MIQHSACVFFLLVFCDVIRVLSSFCNHLHEAARAVCFTLIAFLLSSGASSFSCCGLVCECDVSWSYSFASKNALHYTCIFESSCLRKKFVKWDNSGLKFQQKIIKPLFKSRYSCSLECEFVLLRYVYDATILSINVC